MTDIEASESDRRSAADAAEARLAMQPARIAADIATARNSLLASMHLRVWHPNATGGPVDRWSLVPEVQARHVNEHEVAGTLGWSDLLAAATAEALAGPVPAGLRQGLVKTAAVAAAWIEAIDRTVAGGPPGSVNQSVATSNARICEGRQ